MILGVCSVIVATVLLTTCGGNTQSNEAGVKITGTVENIVPNGTAVLQQIVGNGPVPVDTALINSDGSYEMTVSIEEPSFYRLTINERQIITLILTGEEIEVEVYAEGNQVNGYSEVSGSYDTQYMRDMDALMSAFEKEVQQLNQQAMEARSQGNSAAFEAVALAYQELARSNNDQLKKQIWKSVPSLAAFYGIQRLDPEQYFSFFDSVSVALSKELPENSIVQDLASMVSAKRSLAIGAEAPEISLQNPEGETISLSSLRGSYVLLDFWAAWCKPCRAENPNIVRAYDKYKSENFEILQVSLDRTREAWLGAIEQDGLPWLHISDLKYWNSIVTKSYQINAIPASYLIDPDGKIIGKNLRGPMLEEKLREIFG